MAGMGTPQMQEAGLCLKYPTDLGLHASVNLETAFNMLSRALQMSATTPFHWGYIDQPKEGQLYLIFLPHQTPFPNDGIRYLEAEAKFAMPGPHGREIEVHESKHGFIPNSGDPNAWRLRRRFRIMKGGNASLALVHYTRGPSTPVMPSLMNQPIRTYPLRPVQEAAVFVNGDKVGVKVPPAGGGPGPGPMGMNNMAMGMNIHQQQALLAAQNNKMEMLDRSRAMGGVRPSFPPHHEEIAEIEDGDIYTTRSLAMARYRRNHEFMNDIFRHAAYRGKYTPDPPVSYSIFDKNELEEKAQKLEKELEALKVKSAQRREAKTSNADVSMEAPSIVV
ncbi:hypothetical protein BDZ89DRAFT_1056784 [Hymenopellis radicata]|nr:hypothetical protein BDZ89DRAFT_1056784 [Hymenopellis radicata]